MFQRQFQRLFPLVRASADDVPLDDESFDFAISEYGASTWLDPYWWVPEAARLLRPGGRLVFFVSGALMIVLYAGGWRVRRRESSSMIILGCIGLSLRGSRLSSFIFRMVIGAGLRANGFELEESDRGAAVRGRVDAVPVCLRRVGATLAERRDLDRPPDAAEWSSRQAEDRPLADGAARIAPTCIATCAASASRTRAQLLEATGYPSRRRSRGSGPSAGDGHDSRGERGGPREAIRHQHPPQHRGGYLPDRGHEPDGEREQVRRARLSVAISEPVALEERRDEDADGAERPERHAHDDGQGPDRVHSFILGSMSSSGKKL